MQGMKKLIFGYPWKENLAYYVKNSLVTSCYILSEMVSMKVKL